MITIAMVVMCLDICVPCSSKLSFLYVSVLFAVAHYYKLFSLLLYTLNHSLVLHTRIFNHTLGVHVLVID